MGEEAGEQLDREQRRERDRQHRRHPRAPQRARPAARVERRQRRRAVEQAHRARGRSTEGTRRYTPPRSATGARVEDLQPPARARAREHPARAGLDRERIDLAQRGKAVDGDRRRACGQRQLDDPVGGGRGHVDAPATAVERDRVGHAEDPGAVLDLQPRARAVDEQRVALGVDHEQPPAPVAEHVRGADAGVGAPQLPPAAGVVQDQLALGGREPGDQPRSRRGGQPRRCLAGSATFAAHHAARGALGRRRRDGGLRRRRGFAGRAARAAGAGRGARQGDRERPSAMLPHAMSLASGPRRP